MRAVARHAPSRTTGRGRRRSNASLGETMSLALCAVAVAVAVAVAASAPCLAFAPRSARTLIQPADSARTVAGPARTVARPATTAAFLSALPEAEIAPVDGSSDLIDTADADALAPTETEATVDDGNAFSLLAGLSAVALLRSDQRRDATGKGEGAIGSSATNWIDERSAFALQKTLDRMELKLADQRTGLDRDEASTWIRWMKASPTPLLIDLSQDFRSLANGTISDENLDLIGTTRSDFLNRLGCRLVLLPSGSDLKDPLMEPSGGVVYGKLLYGGVTRYRVLPSSTSDRPSRRAGEATETKASIRDNVPGWVQYGGPDRKYEALDMGPAAVLEVTLLPIGEEMPSLFEVRDGAGGDMSMSKIVWSPKKMFGFAPTGDDEDGASMGGSSSTEEDQMGDNLPATLSGRDRNEAFASGFRSSVGGLRPQIDAIVRRVLDGRVIRPADEIDAERANGGNTGDGVSAEVSLAAEEAEELALLGLTPVRGLLLYGPPGCGKTALAREISRALKARAPKIVSAPELLDRWVGGSEKLVRSLFAEAEAELASVNGDPSRSALHVVVIDEIDAVFRKRSTAEDSGEATRSSAVNQILAKLDGVEAIPNVLLIGMTNRRELLDEAMLRPGRLEVQIEIPLPDREGRREILHIHFDALRRRGRLSKPLCCAIDGVAGYGDDDEPALSGDAGTGEELSADGDGDTTDSPRRGSKRLALKRVVAKVIESVPLPNPVYDLAADSVTGGFSGADIAGLVRCAGSIALSRARRDGSGVDGLLITLEDVKEALGEVKQ